MRPRFVVAYVVLFAVFALIPTLAMVSLIHSPPRVVPVESGLVPITNDTWPNEIETHFAGKPVHTFPANLIPGMSPDGYCKDYSNGVSWRVFVCMGTQPESQPSP